MSDYAGSVTDDLAAIAEVPPAPDDYRRTFRLRVARAEMPVLLRVWALVFAAVSLVDLLDVSEIVAPLAVHAMVVVLLLVASFIVAQPRFPAAGLAWAYAAAMAVTAGLFTTDFAEYPTPNRLALVVVVIATFGPLTQEWVPFIAGALVVAAVDVYAAGGQGLFGIGVAALATLVVLRMRIRSLTRQADITWLANELATTDVLTGLLNRHGLERTVPRLRATADRLVQPVVVWLFAVDGLVETTRALGEDAADDVLRAVADALRSVAEPDDLVGRVSESQFLVLGLGTTNDRQDVPGRVIRRLRESPAFPVDAPLRLAYGSASDLQSISSLQRLMVLAAADLRHWRAPGEEPVD